MPTRIVSSDSYVRFLVPPIKQPAPEYVKNTLPEYRITHLLGSGGFADVYGGSDPDGLAVAIKVPQFKMDKTLDSSVLDKFALEADIWSKLDHENIVNLHARSPTPLPHIVIELMEGGDLESLMKNHKLSVKETLHIMLQILEGMSYAHRMASVHRDLKPENILFTKDGVAKITDWGIGKYMASEGITKTIETKGTFAYSAPEQFDSRKYGEVDWQTDIFQLGIVFYEMLTGVKPFEGRDMAEVMGKVLTYEPDPPSSLNPDVPPELDDIVMRALLKNKKRRWASGAVMLDRLKYIVEKWTYLKEQQFHEQPSTNKEAGVPMTTPIPICLKCGRASYYYSEYNSFWCEECQDYVYPKEASEASSKGVPQREVNRLEQSRIPYTRQFPDQQPIQLQQRLNQLPMMEQPTPQQITYEPKETKTMKKPMGRKKRSKKIAIVSIVIIVLLIGCGMGGYVWYRWDLDEGGTDSNDNSNVNSIEDIRQINFQWIDITRGAFMMGSSASEGYDNEHPQHEITISKYFQMLQFEVTQAQWELVMGNNPSSFTGYDDKPVETVSWNDCQSFVSKLNEIDSNYTYRLPTEAEWEYSCRADSNTTHCYGNDIAQLGEYAHYDDNSDVKTHVVGKKMANAWGLHDMHGNVGEWCQDWYDEDFYGDSPDIDPQGTTSGLDRVIRGGCWYSDADYCRSAYRDHIPPTRRSYYIGLRLVRVLHEDKDTDGDGVGDNLDAFPNDRNETSDRDDDGVGDNSDKFPDDPAASIDIDGDGWPDKWNEGMTEEDSITRLHLDAFPYDPVASMDTDGDDWPDKWNEGKTQSDSTTGLHLDAFPNDPAASVDADNDGYPDEWNTGKDANNSTSEPQLSLDAFPNDKDEWADSDDDGVGDNQQFSDLNFEWVDISSGTFTMGSNWEEDPENPYQGEGGYENEQPVHQVTISKNFQMLKYELTQAQWEAVIGTTPWRGQYYSKEGDDYPATNISWNDCQDFVDELNTLDTSHTYSLPTEAEWEYCCRAGSNTDYCYGDDAGQLVDYAWYRTNAYDANEKYVHEVGQKLPNAWGLYDMHGNAWEWCQDWSHSDYNNAPDDGTAWEDPVSSYRVYRGGGWSRLAETCRSAVRYWKDLDYDIGLRLVRLQA